MIDFLFFLSLVALAYCLYQIRRLKSDVAVAVGGSTLLLDYIVEQRGALLHLVVESLKDGDEPPSGASNLEIKVARFMLAPPTTRKELADLWNWQPRRDP
jgi:hypothetical protein